MPRGLAVPDDIKQVRLPLVCDTMPISKGVLGRDPSSSGFQEAAKGRGGAHRAFLKTHQIILFYLMMFNIIT